MRPTPPGRPWVRMTMGAAEVFEGPEGLVLELLPQPGDRYADAQLDDYSGARLRWRPPVRLTVEARFSAPAAAWVGTAGFGFWNAGALPGALAAPPSAVWFFFASSPSRLALSPDDPGPGWRAMVWRSPRAPRLLLPPGWASRVYRWLAHPRIARVAVDLGKRWMAVSQRLLEDLDRTAWHRYEIRWERDRVTFTVDGVPVHTASFAPAGPLGFVAWVDNQFLRLDPERGIASGFLEVPQPQALILRRMAIEAGDGWAEIL